MLIFRKIKESNVFFSLVLVIDQLSVFIVNEFDDQISKHWLELASIDDWHAHPLNVDLLHVFLNFYWNVDSIDVTKIEFVIVVSSGRTVILEVLTNDFSSNVKSHYDIVPVSDNILLRFLMKLEDNISRNSTLYCLVCFIFELVSSTG